MAMFILLGILAISATALAIGISKESAGLSIAPSVILGLSVILIMILGIAGLIQYEEYLDVKGDYAAGMCERYSLEKLKVRNNSFLYGWAIPDDVEDIRCRD